MLGGLLRSNATPFTNPSQLLVSVQPTLPDRIGRNARLR
jgi:hypothetical protein